MKTVVIGTGYVGLVAGTCFAELGAAVTCLDIDKKKIDALRKGKIPIFENGLEELVKKNLENKRLRFSAEINAALKTADVIFLAVGTPSAKDGSANLTYIYNAARTIGKNAKNGCVVVTKSTVPVGTNHKIKSIIQKTNPKLKFDVASNPEFLREGSAVIDFMVPDRVIIGTESKNVFEKIASYYRPIVGVKIFHTDIATAETIKYTANAYLAMRIAFINEIADLCEKIGADVEDVSEGIGLDSRIGGRFLKVGPGFGGSCFPKDTLALQKTAADEGSPIKIIETVIRSNDERKVKMARKIIKAAGGYVKGKKIGVLGLAFKANTDDIRDSSALVIIEELLKAGAKVLAYDPEAMANAKQYFGKRPDLGFARTKEEIIKNSSVIAVVTEWPEFKNIETHSFKSKTLVDLRNIYDPKDMKGIRYISLGRR